MGTIYEVKNSGEILLKKFAANPTPAEGMLVYNCTDKKLRYYNGTVWKDSGGSAFYTDPTAYVVYDDFTCVDGSVWSTSKWVCAHSGNLGSMSRCINTNRGFIGNAVGGGGSGGDSYDCITSCAIPAGRSVYVEFALGTWGIQGSGDMQHLFGNDTDGWHTILNLGGVRTDIGWTTCGFTGHSAIARGANSYELFRGGVSLCCVTLPNGVQVRFVHHITTPSSCSQAASSYYDNVRYSCS